MPAHRVAAVGEHDRVETARELVPVGQQLDERANVGDGEKVPEPRPGIAAVDADLRLGQRDVIAAVEAALVLAQDTAALHLHRRAPVHALGRTRSERAGAATGPSRCQSSALGEDRRVARPVGVAATMSAVTHRPAET